MNKTDTITEEALDEMLDEICGLGHALAVCITFEHQGAEQAIRRIKSITGEIVGDREDAEELKGLLAELQGKGEDLACLELLDRETEENKKEAKAIKEKVKGRMLI